MSQAGMRGAAIEGEDREGHFVTGWFSCRLRVAHNSQITSDLRGAVRKLRSESSKYLTEPFGAEGYGVWNVGKSDPFSHWFRSTEMAPN